MGEFYQDLGSPKRASVLAVEGTVIAIDARSVEDDIPFTDFRFRISRLLYNPQYLLQGDGQGSELIDHPPDRRPSQWRTNVRPG